jgi:hypothetical protein
MLASLLLLFVHFFLFSLLAALILTSVPAINFAAFNSIPFALTADIVGEKGVGLYMGV